MSNSVNFSELPNQEKASKLLRFPKKRQLQIVSSLSDEQLFAILEHLDPDEATDIIQLLPKHRAKSIVNEFNEATREQLEILSRFDPKTAAGLMNLDYIQVDLTDTVRDVAKQFHVHESRTGRMPVVLVMDNGKLSGYVPIHKLGFTGPDEGIEGYIRKVTTIGHNATYNEVADLFSAHPHDRAVVVGPNGNVMGIIYSDDILRLLRKEQTTGLYSFAGVDEEESVLDPAWYKVKLRYKWLIINLATGFLAAFIVSLFEETISKYVLLAVYMPIVAGMGGNSATQTLVVVVRGISQSQIELRTAWNTLKNELIAALVNGLINGALVAAIVLLFNRDVNIAIILALAMIINLLVAAFFGTLIPLVMKRLGKDPATSATILITTATDVLGFLAFLGIATVLLS